MKQRKEKHAFVRIPMSRPLARPNVDETKCFVCQENEPTHSVKTFEAFKVCDVCLELVRSENEKLNQIRQALTSDRNKVGGKIFQYTLGLSPVPRKLRIEKL